MIFQKIINYVQTDLLLADDFLATADNRAIVNEYAVSLPGYYKDILYNEYSLNPWKTATVNLFTGGIGSILEGDYLTGIIVEVGTLLSYAAMAYTFAPQEYESKQTFILISKIGSVSFTLLGIGLPFVKSYFHNSKLKNALGIEN